MNSTCLKKYVDQEFDRTQTQTQTQTQRLHEAEKKLFRLICSSDWHSNKIWFVKSFFIDTLVFMFYRYVNEMGVLYGVTYRSKFSQVIFPIEN